MRFFGARGGPGQESRRAAAIPCARPALRGAASGSGWPELAAAPAALGRRRCCTSSGLPTAFSNSLLPIRARSPVAPASISHRRVCGACSRIRVCSRIVSRKPARLRSHTITTWLAAPSTTRCTGVTAARQIDDDPGEFAAQLVEQHVDRAGIDDQLLGRRRFGRQNPQIVGDLDHRPLDEQAVDARRLLQRFAQPAAGIGVELERDRAEMQVEIDERGALAALLGQQPGAGHRGGRRADAAAAAEKGDRPGRARRRPPPPPLPRFSRPPRALRGSAA